MTAISKVWWGRAEDLRAALVTGASGQLGRTVAAHLAAAGWRVAVHAYRRREDAEALVGHLRVQRRVAVLVEADLSRPASEVPRLVAEARRALGPIGLLVHAACPPVREEPPTASLDVFDEMVTVNARAYLELARHLLPEMLAAQHGTLLGVLSTVLRAPVYGRWRSYAVAKAALAGAIGALASETEGTGVRALAVAPGAFAPAADGTRGASGGTIGLTADAVSMAILEVVEQPEKYANGSCRVMAGGEPDWVTRLLLDGRAPAVAAPDPATQVPPARPISQLTAGASNNLSERVRDVLASVLGVAPEADLSQAALGSYPGWDSLNHIVLMMELESRFGVQLTASRIGQLTSAAKIEAVLRNLLGAKP